MTKEEFERLIDELDSNSLIILKERNSKYAPKDDALRNFHVGAEIMGATPAECILGYATKHMSSLRDRIKDNNWDDLDDVKEKIQDTINYLRFLWCVANEEVNKNKKTINNNLTPNTYDCLNCRYDWIGDEDSHWNGNGRVIIEPCKSCKNNFGYETKEWEEADYNFEEK